MEAITEASSKRRFKNCKLKAFVFDDGTYTSSWKKAATKFNDGVPTHMVVHCAGFGQWTTSKITSMVFSRGRKYVETDRNIYEVKGIEPQKRVKEIRFYIEGSDMAFSTKSISQLARVLSLLELGCTIRAEVFFRDGTSHFTSDIIEFYPAKKKLVTSSHSIYRW